MARATFGRSTMTTRDGLMQDRCEEIVSEVVNVRIESLLLWFCSPRWPPFSTIPLRSGPRPAGPSGFLQHHSDDSSHRNGGSRLKDKMREKMSEG